MDWSMAGFPVHHQFPELAQTHVHQVGDAIQPSYPLLSLSPPAFSLSQCQGLLNELALCIRWPKYWSFTFSINPSNEYQDWFPLGLTGLNSLQSKGLSRVSLNTTVQKHQFFGTRPSLWSNSHPHMTIGKTTALTIWTFVGRVMSLFFNRLSRFVIAFLPSSKHLVISWLQSPSTVIFGAQKSKICTCFHCFPIYLPGGYGTGCHNLGFLNVEF